MRRKNRLEFDTVGYWTEIKLDIVKEYLPAYTTILHSKKKADFHYIYIDAFSGAGVHISKETGEPVPGSPLNALSVQPPFMEHYLIDLDTKKVGVLKEIIGNRQDVHVFEGDCNKILLEKVFPNVRYDKFQRALCLLDPYGLHLNWEIVKAAGESNSIDIFLNFPVMDMNRNVFWKNPDGVDLEDIARMTAFWGDESWKTTVYRPVPTLPGFGEMVEKAENEEVAQAFQKRLKEVGGFEFVPKPLPMRNSKGAIVYYLFFASQKEVAKKIVTAIFKKYESKGGH